MRNTRFFEETSNKIQCTNGPSMQKTKNKKHKGRVKKYVGGLVATSWKEKEINFFFFYFWVEESYPLGAHMSRIDA